MMSAPDRFLRKNPVTGIKTTLDCLDSAVFYLHLPFLEGGGVAVFTAEGRVEAVQDDKIAVKDGVPDFAAVSQAGLEAKIPSQRGKRGCRSDKFDIGCGNQPHAFVD